MHKSAFMAMLPWFAHYDHTNYTRWGVIYGADICQLDSSHPDVYQQFMDGDFVVKSTRKSFNQISTDLALEHVNKVGKVAGGLIGITRTDNARDKWCLTYNERSRIVDETTSMRGMAIDDTEYTPSTYKDVGPARIKRDREDVQKLQEQFSRFQIFDSESNLGDELTCLVTMDVAPENIKDALLAAETHGESKIKEFVESRICKQDVGCARLIMGASVPVSWHCAKTS